MLGTATAGEAPAGVTVVRTDTEQDSVTVSDVLAAARCVGLTVVTARPGYNGNGRRSDLALDLLDALGRVGCQRAVRRVHEQDLIFLLPYLLTEPVGQLLICEAQWLALEGLSDLLAVTELAGIDVTLHIGEPPTPAIERWLAGQGGRNLDATAALSVLRQQPAAAPTCTWNPEALRRGQRSCDGHNSATACILENLRHHVRDGVDPQEAKDVVCDLIAGSSSADQDQLRWAFGRDSARAAALVLHRHHGLAAADIAHLGIRDIDHQGQLLGAHQRLPAAAAAALLRQRIYAGLSCFASRCARRSSPSTVGRWKPRRSPR